MITEQDFDDVEPVFPRPTPEQIAKLEDEICANPEAYRDCPSLLRSAYWGQLERKRLASTK